MLRQLASSLWVDEVSFRMIGIDFGNRMTCVQLSDGSFWLHSPTKYNRSTHDQITALGPVRYLVTPSLMHNLFIMSWKKRDKDARVLAPAKAKKVAADISLDSMSAQEINQLHNGEISCIPIEGMPLLQEYAFVHHASKTLILTDLAFNFQGHLSGWPKLFLILYGAHRKFGPTITIRTLVKDKQAFGESMRLVMSHDFDRIIVSHGEVLDSGGKAAMEKAFKKYLAPVTPE